MDPFFCQKIKIIRRQRFSQLESKKMFCSHSIFCSFYEDSQKIQCMLRNFRKFIHMLDVFKFEKTKNKHNYLIALKKTKTKKRCLFLPVKRKKTTILGAFGLRIGSPKIVADGAEQRPLAPAPGHCFFGEGMERISFTYSCKQRAKPISTYMMPSFLLSVHM